MVQIIRTPWRYFSSEFNKMKNEFSDTLLDEAALRKLVQRQIYGGVDFLVPCGTTGGDPTLTRSEHLRVVEITLQEGAGKIPILAGAGGYNTQELIELAHELESLGVNGLLSVTPYYNKPTQEGLYQHYRAIARSTHLPIVLYKVPMGLLEPVWRLPTVAPKAENLERIQALLQSLQLVERNSVALASFAD
jgi:dihydrodipicolinate synthase/N-acetylneuraminate lyase